MFNEDKKISLKYGWKKVLKRMNESVLNEMPYTAIPNTDKSFDLELEKFRNMPSTTAYMGFQNLLRDIFSGKEIVDKYENKIILNTAEEKEEYKNQLLDDLQVLNYIKFVFKKTPNDVEKFIASVISTPLKEEELKGGKSDGKTLESIAKKHNVSIEVLKKEWNIGIDVEKEHTKDNLVADEIVKDHLMEDPRYYTKLKKAKLEESVELSDKEKRILYTYGGEEGLSDLKLETEELEIEFNNMKLSLNNQLGRMHKQGTSAIEKAFFARNVDGIKEYVFSSEEKKKELVNSMKVRSSRLAMIKLQNEEKLKPSSVDPKTVRTDDMATEKPFAAERGGTGGTYGGTMAIELVNPENALEPMFGKQKANDVMFLTSLANAESLENSDFINMFPTDPNTSAHIYRYLIKGEPKNENEKGPLLRKIDAIIVSLRGLIPRQNILKHYSEKKMEVNSLMEGYKAFIRFYKK